MKRPLIFLIALWAGLCGAQGLTQKLVGAEDLSVGDRFKLEIRAELDLRTVVVPDTLSVFQVLGTRVFKDPSGRRGLEVIIVPLYPGSHSFPRLEVKPADDSRESLFTDRFRLNIIPVRTAADTLLVDIKPLEKYPLQLPWWLYPALLGLAVAGLVFAWLLRPGTAKIQESAPERPPAPVTPDPAWKTALNRLEALVTEELMSRGQFKLHHFRLADILRQFLESKYRFAALEMCTSEIEQVTQRIRVDAAAEVLAFLRHCDRVKFAKYQPTQDEARALEDWLRDWLRSFEVEEARRVLATVGGGSA